MLLKKFEDFKNNKLNKTFVLENMLPPGTELMKNKEDLVQKMKNLPNNNEEDWGNDANFIMDMREVFYNMYSDKENQDIDSIDDMVYYAFENYGILPGFTILLSNYNGQVNNGGHIQYFGNGYASSGSSGAFQSHDDLEMHDVMLDAWKESGFNKFSKSGRKAFEVAQEFEIERAEDDCSYCGGSGQEEEEVEHEDEEGDTYTETEYDTCGECRGTGTIESDDMEVVNADVLDSRLYDVNSRLLYDLERFLMIKYLD